MNRLMLINKTLQAKAEKVDKFINTYVRCFDEADKRKVLRRNNLGKFTFSISTGPLPLAAMAFFPYELFIADFNALHFAYTMPIYLGLFFLTREFFGNISFRRQLRFREKLIEKYKVQFDLSKDQIEEIEADLKSQLKIDTERREDNLDKS